ncbi:MAG: flagellar export protein FliJ [bacterium]|nr:flagellar export protein FliJ [bacterium]
MPKFRFSLQRLIDVRKHREEVLINELAVVKRKYLDEEEILEDLKELLSINVRRLKERQERIASIEEIILYYNYFTKMDEEILKQKEKLKKIQEEINIITEKLIKASQEKRVVEKLREKHLSEFRKLIEKLEQSDMDEIGINLHYRKVR